MKRIYNILIIGFLTQLIVVGTVEAQQDKIEGEWFTTDEQAKIAIFRGKEGYNGKVIWLADMEEGAEAPLDTENEDPSLRERSILGLNILEGLAYEDGEWVDGELYDPESGKIYRCLARFKRDEDQLEVRGYLGMPAFGKSVLWERVK
ncbi:DUF2147 domain-containing protein [Echinicola vietnamensis]|nr:DUF2147 domain-containing protein [Echinicola vietnamensis]